MIYIPFGNVRSCTGSQNGEGRPGDNLFGSSVVALDYKTGAYKWHFQAVKHDIWDMDNALTPVLADVVIGGQTKKVLFYGSKSAFQFTLDRTNGKPVLPIEYRAVPGDTRNAPALTQPIPLQSRYNKPNPINGDTLCMVPENLGTNDPKFDGVHFSKGHPQRLAPNWNGMQAQPDPANPGQLKLVFNPNSYLAPQEPFMVGPPRNGCLYDGSYENFLYVFPPSQNGGNDMTITSMSPKLNMRYVGLSYMPGAHPLQQGGNGLRMIGGYQSGAILGVNNSTGEVVWYKRPEVRPLAPAQPAGHRHRPAVPHPDGRLAGRTGRGDRQGAVALPDGCAEPGRHDLVRWSTASSTSRRRTWPAASRIRKAATASRSGPSSSAARRSTTPARAPARPSCRAAARPRLRCRSRAGVVRSDNTAAGIVPANEIWMARSNNTATSTGDSVNTNSMIPSQRTVPVGTTVTFRNPGVGDVPDRAEPEGALRDAVLRRQVQLQAATGPDGAVHVRP